MAAAFAKRRFVGEVAPRDGERRQSDLDLDALDAVCGGLSLTPGGSIQERQTPYSWWGMQYTQTERTAYDANGNVTGTEVVRPGSVWSDRTETQTDGSSHTTYDIGGNGLAAQLSTHHDADGNFQGANVDARANVGIGDFSVTSNLRGGIELSRDANGEVNGFGTNAHADVAVTHDPSGVGVRLGGDLEASSHAVYDQNGNLSGFDARGSAAVPLDVTYNGDRVVGLNLAGAQVGLHGEATDNGFAASVDAGRTVLGTSVSGEAHVQTDGDALHFGASADASRQLLGPYGARAEAHAGFESTVGGDRPGFTAGASAQASVFGQPLASASGEVSADGNGVVASGTYDHVPLPDHLPDVPLPDHLPDLSNIPVPDVHLPDHLPDVHANPTGLPGTNGYDSPQAPAPDTSANYGGEPQASNDVDHGADASPSYDANQSYSDAGTSSDAGASYADAGTSSSSDGGDAGASDAGTEYA